MKSPSLVLGAAMFAAALSGFSSHAADSKIAEIEASGKLRVCHAEDNPWTFRDPATDKWEGFTRDLAADFAEDLGVELVDVSSSWKTIIPSLLNDECDLAGGGLYAKLSRAKVILFALPFAYAGSTAVVHKDSGMTTYDQLDQPGHVIVVKSGTAQSAFAQKFFKKAEVKVFTSDTDAVILAEIANKRADGYWTSSTKGQGVIKENPQFNARLIGEASVGLQAVGWGIAAGEYHFTHAVNIWLEEHVRAGKTAALWEKWFGIPYERGDHLKASD